MSSLWISSVSKCLNPLENELSLKQFSIELVYLPIGSDKGIIDSVVATGTSDKVLLNIY